MVEAGKLLDDLSNWYIRRNRRRFWKSENDADKNAAYFTLHSVLVDFVKVLAPVIPFVTDEMYSNLTNCMDAADSVHLADFPKADDNLTDQNILNEVDTIIQVVGLSRSARNKANIKIRQPLSELALFADANTCQIALDNQTEILEELNIKSLRIIQNEKDLVTYKVKPNFQLLGQKFGKDMGKVTAGINDCDQAELVSQVKVGKTVVLPGEDIEILAEEFLIEAIPAEGYEISSSKNITAGIVTEITQELKEEGMVRDLIRQIQNLRKDSGLKVEDRIEIGIHGSQELNNAVTSHKNYFMNEVLGVKLDMDDIQLLTFKDSVKINGESITIGITPLQ
jgi:isoleucyl-tRNA synthetase